MNATRCWIEVPEPDFNASECIQIGKSSCRRISGQHENRGVREIPVAVSLGHPSSPVLKLCLKCTNRGCHVLKELLARCWLLSPLCLPRNSEQVCYAKTVNSNLAGTCDFELVGTIMNRSELLKIGSRKLDCEPGLRRGCSDLPPWQVTLWFPESHFWHRDCGYASHIGKSSGRAWKKPEQKPWRSPI